MYLWCPQASVQLGQRLKTEGNDLFKSGQYVEALTKYTQALTIFQTCAAFLSTDAEMTATYSNMSAAHRKAFQFDQAVECASKCIALNKNFAKVGR